MRGAKVSFWAWAAIAGALAAGLGGCEPNQQQLLMKAVSARMDRQADFNSSAKFVKTAFADKHDKDYVMWGMEYGSLCLMGGNGDAARSELMTCFKDIAERQDKGSERAAAVSAESFKVFKGEPFERATLCCYLSLLHYSEGEYNEARIFASQALMADATTANNMSAFRDDFGLAHYLLGKAFQKLGQVDNARICFQKASAQLPRPGQDKELKSVQKAQKSQRDKMIRLEKTCYEQALKAKPPVEGVVNLSTAYGSLAEAPDALPGADGPNPVLVCPQTREDFFSPAFQQEANLFLFIELGTGPVKFLVGENQSQDAILRGAYPERQALVYLNGHKAGAAMCLVDLFHQADTRGTTEKDAAQAAKDITKSILKQLPYVGGMAGYWDVRADDRFWRLLPGEVHVLAAKVRPGLYTVTVRCYDANGFLLPRHTLTRYYLPVLPDRENLYLIHTLPEADNTYVPPKK